MSVEPVTTETVSWCCTLNGYAAPGCRHSDHVHYDVEVSYPSGRVLTTPTVQAERRTAAEGAAVAASLARQSAFYAEVADRNNGNPRPEATA